MNVDETFVPDYDIALFLDVDGTLIEIAATPDAVEVPSTLAHTLVLASQREGGALALISGRPVEELDQLFAPLVFPAAGQHGLERRNAHGKIARSFVDVGALRNAREALVRLQATNAGLLLEDKGTALAMHYRLAPHLECEVTAVLERVAEPLQDTFMLRPGKCVLELAPRGYSKRSAIEAFMKEPPFAGRTPVFLGDDVTDEDGFRAVNDLGGHSIRVGGLEPTAARHRFGSVREVIAWLRDRNQNRHLAATAC
jgi:trehalose 6-phosphate phosphatase